MLFLIFHGTWWIIIFFIVQFVVSHSWFFFRKRWMVSPTCLPTMTDFAWIWKSRMHRLKAWCRSLWVDTIRNSCSLCPRAAIRCSIGWKDYSSLTKRAPLLRNQSLTRPSSQYSTRGRQRCSSIICLPSMKKSLKIFNCKTCILIKVIGKNELVFKGMVLFDLEYG